MISTKSYRCTLSNCNRSFDTQKGLVWHQRRDANHNPNITFTRPQAKLFNTAGNKRHSIPYEFSKIAESGKEKKKLGGPQYVDVDILKSMLSSNNSTGNELDNNYYGLGDKDFDEDEDENENDLTIIRNNGNHS